VALCATGDTAARACRHSFGGQRPMPGYIGEGLPPLKVKSEEPEDQEWYLHSLIEEGGADEAILMLIIETHYKQAKHRDKAYGNTLLHHAMQHRSSAKLVDFLLEEWPEATMEVQDPANDHVGPTAKPNYHWLPLHLGAMAGASFECMQMVLEEWPDAASKPDTLDQSMPIHLCVCRNTDERVLRLLIDAYPKGCEHLAGNMELPLHKAIAKAKPSVVKMLVEAFPRGVKQRTYPLDRMTPIEMAKERLKEGKIGTPEQAQEIIDLVTAAKKEVDADFKEYVKTMKKA